MILLAYAKVRAGSYTGAAFLDSQDTDVYVQEAYISQQLHKLLLERKNAFNNCCLMFTEAVADIIIPLHVLTDSDHTSGFYVHGKKQFLEKVMKDSK